MPKSGHGLGVAAVVTTALLWGSNHVVARAVRDAVPLPSLVFWRWLIGAALLTLVAAPSLRRAWPFIRDNVGAIAAGGAIGVGLFSFLLLGGAYYSPAIEVGLINATTPVWVALIGSMTGHERLDARMWRGLWVSLGGTLVIIAKGDPMAAVGLTFGWGNVLSLSAAITFAWFSLRVRVWSRSVDALALTVATAWSGILLVMLPVYAASLALGGPWFVLPSADPRFAGAAILYTAIGPTMLGNLFYLFGIGHLGPTRAATFLYLSPVFSALLAIGWLGERLAWFHIVGVGMIALGLWMVACPAGTGRALVR
ncbi:DMT family transporter [Methylobacterium oryzisoli]|uniref:DMT family transporter n=1 Tax=Methylobacterium oryzisoli TaxID=3385502 RepID=UPI0038916654